MSEETKPPSGRGWIAGAGVAALAVVLGVGGLVAFQTPQGPTDGVDPVPVPPRPTVDPAAPRPAALAVANGRARVSLPPPEDHELPEPPEDPTPPPITPEVKREMNVFVDDLLRAASEGCVLPWLEEFEEPTQAELVFDAVMYDGQMYDFGMRSLDHDLPERVQRCVADEVWALPSPTIDLTGEVRLQRSATYRSPEG